jgi:hypothetical protein
MAVGKSWRKIHQEPEYDGLQGQEAQCVRVVAI